MTNWMWGKKRMLIVKRRLGRRRRMTNRMWGKKRMMIVKRRGGAG